MVSKNTNFYEILGVSKNASQDDLDEAYVKAATKNHRDHDDDPEKFKEVKQAYGEAYMVLSNPLEREIHDQYCEDGGRRRDFIHPLMVSLEDLYNGTTRNIPLFRRSVVTCSKCKGIGGGSRTNDEGCFQQQCKGEKVVEDKFHKDFEVHIEKGMQGGQKIRFSGEALNGVSGGRDMVVILLQKKHPIFKRKGGDLFVELTISATQALRGHQIVLTHLDNREIIIQSPQEENGKHDHCIHDAGMPMYQRPFMRGKLYIRFKVDFTSPKLLSRPSPQLTDMEEVDWTTLDHHVNIEDEIRKMKRGRRD